MAHIKFTGAKLDPKSIEALVASTLVQGNATSKWWRRQSSDFLNNFMDTIRVSMRNGENITQAIARIAGGTVDGVFVPGIMKISKGKAGALAATSINAVSNRAALESFQLNNDVVKWVSQMSTLDNRTSDICIAYSGQTWDLMTLQPVLGTTLPFNGGPPRHFNCRSRLRPVTKSFDELGVDAPEIPVSTRASMDGQIPADITFNQFLRGKSTAFQDDLIGPSRAQLWRDNKITLTQLVDMRGNPMTLTQLETKLGMKPKPTFDPATNRVKDGPKPPKKPTPKPTEEIGGISQAEADAQIAELAEAAEFKKITQFNDSVVNFITSGGNTEKMILDWIASQGKQGISKKVRDTASNRVKTAFKTQAKKAKKIIDDLDKKYPDGLIAFQDAAGDVVVSFETADPLLAKALREQAKKVMAQPARQDAALLAKIEKRIDQGVPESAARTIIQNSQATDAAKKKATALLDDAIKAAKQEADIALKQIADIEFDSIGEFTAWIKGIQPGLSNKFAQREFQILAARAENKVITRITLKSARQQIELGDLEKAEGFLKKLTSEQTTKEVTDELAKIAKRRIEIKETAQKVMDDLTNKGALPPSQIDDAVTAASEIAKPTMKKMIQDIGFEMSEKAQGKINVLVKEFPEKVFDDLAKKGFSTKQMALLEDEFIDQIGVLKLGVFDEAVSANMVTRVQEVIDQIDDAVRKIKALNKSSKGVEEMTSIINALPDKARISKLLQDQIKGPFKAAAKKATAARKLVSDELLVKQHISPADFSLYKELIKDSLKDVHKKLGPKQLQAKVNEIKSKVASAKKGDVSIAEFAKDPTAYDDQVRALLSNDAMKKLDNVVKSFIDDGAGSSSAKSNLFDLLYNKSEKQTRAIKEYVHRRVNPKTLSNGANFDAKVAEIVTKHVNNVDAKVIRASIQAITEAENSSVTIHFNQTIMTRAGVKNIDELGVLAEGDAPANVLKIRAQLKSNDPGNLPILETTAAEDFTAAKHWLNSASLGDDEFRRQQLQNSKSLVASGKRKIAEGDKIFGENSWGISPKEWQKWVDDVAPTLTEYDVSLINQYTGGMAGQINAGLYNGGTNRLTMGGANALNKALDKMPKHRGTVYRGTSARSDWTADYIDARYVVGKTVTERGFGSSSTQATSSFNGPLKFVIKSKGKNGAIIGQLGQYGASEMEVLWKAGTRFRVIKKVRSGSEIKIWMEEV